MPPAKSGVHSYTTALRRHCQRIATGEAFAVRQPEFFAVQAVHWRTRHRSEGPIAGAAKIALKSPRLAVGHCTVRTAMRAGPVFSNTHFNGRNRGFTSENVAHLYLLRLAQFVDL